MIISTTNNPTNSRRFFTDQSLFHKKNNDFLYIFKKSIPTPDLLQPNFNFFADPDQGLSVSNDLNRGK